MWESDSNCSDHALTLNLQAFGDDVSTCISSEELCIDSGPDEASTAQHKKGRKRKRSEEEEITEEEEDDDTDDPEGVGMPDVVQQMEAEIERQLEAKARKSNLTVANVKNILKDVITNEHVLELVRHSMKEPGKNFCISKVFSYAPKLTRAKTRELLNTFPSMAWPITQSKTLRSSKCKVLIEQELPEDSSDEEYKPDEEDDHDDIKKQKQESGTCNDDQDDEDDDEEDEDLPDSEDAGVQGDEEEDDDDDDDDDYDVEHELEETSVSHNSAKSETKCRKETATAGEDDDDDDDDDDCRLVICDNDNDITEIASTKNCCTEVSIDKSNATTLIYDTATQTSWSEVVGKKLSNQSENTGILPSEKVLISPEENICHRTRSKFSLSDTPLEAIESAFIPPDITTDMYDSECDDEDWKNFLKGFTEPLKPNTHDAPDDDDEETDPEYNVMAEEEETDDKEELREDAGVMVSRKEVNALMAELFEYIGMLSDDTEAPECYDLFNNKELCESYHHKSNDDELEDIVEHFAGALEEHTEDNVQLDSVSHSKETSLSRKTYSNGTEHNTHRSQTIQDELFSYDPISSPDVMSSPTKTESTYCKISVPLVKLIEQQMRKYVQFLTQHFLLSYLHPVFHVYSIDCKQNLVLLKHHAKNDKKLTCYADNLDEALELMERWEQLHSSEVRKKEYMEFMDKEIELQNVMKKRKQFYRGRFPPRFFEIVYNSAVFSHPTLLPTNPFRCDGHCTTPFFQSEDQLIAMGLEFFMRYAKKYPKIWGKVTVPKMVPLIVEHYLPARRPQSVHTRILDFNTIEDNPIGYFFKNKRAPRTIHYVLPYQEVRMPPSQQPLDLLPQVWRDFILSKK